MSSAPARPAASSARENSELHSRSVRLQADRIRSIRLWPDNDGVNRLLAVFLLATLTGHLLAQSPASFEVASIRPNASNPAVGVAGGAGGPSIAVRGKHFVASALLRDIIRYAYQLEPYQALEGGPRWLDDRFDINAVIPDSVTAVDAHRLMVRALLAERFKLSVRTVTRERSVYELVVARRDGRLGPALTPSTTDCSASTPRVTSAAEYQKLGKPICDMVVQPFRARMQGSARTMADLASLLSRVPVLGAPVLDRTGLKGSFDLDLTYSPDRPGAAPRGPGDPPSLFVAIEEQLGLRLQRTRGGVDVLVIERLEPLAKE